MPGFEIFGDEERKEVHDVLETGGVVSIRFRPGQKRGLESENLRKGVFAKDRRQALPSVFERHGRLVRRVGRLRNRRAETRSWFRPSPSSPPSSPC